MPTQIESRRFEVIDLLRRVVADSADWRLNKAIADAQAAAAAESIWSSAAELEGLKEKFWEAGKTGAEWKAAYLAMAAKLIAEAILAENRRNHERIESALARLREQALSDEEIEELLA